MGTRSEVQHQHGETLQTLTDHKAKSLELLKDPPQIHIDYREDEPYCFCFFFFFQYIFLLAAFSASAFLLLLFSLISIYHQTVASATTQIVLKNVKKLFIHHYTIIQSFILGPRSLHVSLSCCLMLTPRDPAGPLISAGILLILLHNKVTCWGDAVFDKPQFSPITIKTKTQKAENKEK